MMCTVNNVSEIMNKISQFTDENVEQFIKLAKQEEPNLNERGLRESINEIRGKTESAKNQMD